MQSERPDANRSPDLEAAREKYRRERDKRLRSEGSDQFRELMTEGSHSDVDPNVKPGFERPPLREEPDVLVIGGGFGGLLMSVRLLEAGITRFRIIEAGGDFGGTWYWNPYPGVQCDVESYIYMPLLEELDVLHVHVVVVELARRLVLHRARLAWALQRSGVGRGRTEQCDRRGQNSRAGVSA